MPVDEQRYDTLEVERAGPVLRVWLNREKRLNAINQRMLRESRELIDTPLQALTRADDADVAVHQVLQLFVQQVGVRTGLAVQRSGRTAVPSEGTVVWSAV